MRVLVCGSRDFDDKAAIANVLDGLHCEATSWNDSLVVIQGGAPGADSAAGDWAADSSVPYEEYLADWEKHGKAAGPIRNQQMLDEGKPDVVWAFINKPLAESRGTADMVGRARAAGLPTYVVEVSR